MWYVCVTPYDYENASGVTMANRRFLLSVRYLFRVFSACICMHGCGSLCVLVCMCIETTER